MQARAGDPGRLRVMNRRCWAGAVMPSGSTRTLAPRQLRHHSCSMAAVAKAAAAKARWYAGNMLYRACATDGCVSSIGVNPFSSCTLHYQDINTFRGHTMSALAHAINAFARTDGDHVTPIPSLTFHRRQSPTDPLHCIYGFGLGVVAQGAKQVTLADRVVDYCPSLRFLASSKLPMFCRLPNVSM